MTNAHGTDQAKPPLPTKPVPDAQAGDPTQTSPTAIGFGDVTLSGATRHDAVVIRDLTFELQAGSCLALTGEVAALGPALARVLLGHQRPTSGEITSGDLSIGPRGRIARTQLRQRIAVLRPLADAPLNPELPLGEAVIEPLRLLRRRVPKTEIEQAINAALEQAGVLLDPRLLAHQVTPLARQQVALARALVLQPAILLALDPFAGLDPTDRAALSNTLVSVAHNTRCGLLLLTPDIFQAAHPGGRLGVVRDGRLVEIGPAADLTLMPRHPYTELLLNTRPALGGGNFGHPRRRIVLPGA